MPSWPLSPYINLVHAQGSAVFLKYDLQLLEKKANKKPSQGDQKAQSRLKM